MTIRKPKQYTFKFIVSVTGFFFRFVILENLRYMLYAYSPDDPIYFGHKFLLPKSKRTYMSGGAGYVLSRKALKIFIEKGLTDPNACRQSYAGAEDAEMGILFLLIFF